MRRSFLAVLVPLLALSTAAIHCSSSKDAGGDEPSDGGDDSTGGEAGDDSSTDGASETGPDSTPPPVTCTSKPAFGKALRVNHNPDSLRRVANAGMIELPDGRLLVAMLEALDASRDGVFARIVDPVKGTVSADDRLDAETDGLTDASGFQIFSIAGGAVGVRYDNHLRVYVKGKWSPDLASALPFATGDTLQAIVAPSGQVLVTRIKTDAAPFGQAVVYRPDEGGTLGSWSAVQSLDLAGASAAPSRIDRHVLSDGRFMVLVWQGGGGPSVRIRSLSGAWQAPYDKGELGATSTRFDYRVLSDGSIVLVALEASASDTWRATFSTWSPTDGVWTAARLLSKVTSDGSGVIPSSTWPFLFGLGNDLEFVSWVAPCAGEAATCTFKPVSRKYSGGMWGDPQVFDVGTDTTGPDGLAVTALDGSTPVLYRQPGDRSAVQLKARFGTTWTDAITITSGSLFTPTTRVTPRFYGGSYGFWSLAARVDAPDGGTPVDLPSTAGVIDASKKTVAWGLVTAGSFELRGFSSLAAAYADGAGGFTVAVNGATDGMSSAPIVAHFTPAGGSPEGLQVVLPDEKSAVFERVPKTAARPGRDKAALFLVSGAPSDMTATGTRLRAYAWNGIGTYVNQALANETKAPRTFNDSLLVFGCGGAVLYAIDGIDGTHALELVLVKQSGS